MAYLNLYVVFGYFWAWNFVIAMADTTVAGSVATWYWTRDKKKLAFWVVFPSFYRYEWNFTAAVCLFVCLFLKKKKSISQCPPLSRWLACAGFAHHRHCPIYPLHAPSHRKVGQGCQEPDRCCNFQVSHVLVSQFFF